MSDTNFQPYATLEALAQMETRLTFRLGQLEVRMLKWSAGLMLGQVGLTVTLIKLLD